MWARGMRWGMGCVVGAMIAVGCSSSSGGGSTEGAGGNSQGQGATTQGAGAGPQGAGGTTSSCSTITGTYALTGVRSTTDPGTCPSNAIYGTGHTISIGTDASGFTFDYSEFPSSSCKGVRSDCTFSVTCSFAGSNTEGTFDSSYTFTNSGLTGTDTFSTSLPTVCNSVYNVTGVRE